MQENPPETAYCVEPTMTYIQHISKSPQTCQPAASDHRVDEDYLWRLLFASISSDISIRVIGLGLCQKSCSRSLPGLVVLLRLSLAPGLGALCIKELALQLSQSCLHLDMKWVESGVLVHVICS